MSATPGNKAFPKQVRLCRHEEFKAMWKMGRKLYTPHFIFLVAKTDQPARLGITVSRKVGNAVVRNRVKRQIREAFRSLRSQMPMVDISVVARSTAADLSLKEMMDELVCHFRRIY